MLTTRRFALTAALLLTSATAPALAIDEVHAKRADKAIEASIRYLLSAQDKATGGWAIPPKGAGQPSFPAITGLVVNGLLMQPKRSSTEQEAVDAGVRYLLSMAKPDGGIYDATLPSYNTAISISALARVDTPEAKAAVSKGVEFLKKCQWGAEDPATAGGDEPKKVDAAHPYYGGVGYGKHGRPDMSNTAFFMQALADTGVSKEDPAVQRAIKFIGRCQMNGATNDQTFADGSRQGGFVYSTGETGSTPGRGQSQSTAGMIEETLDDGTKVSRLRAYGSMTYAGFKSYVYAALAPTDPRVTTAKDWISRNYTVTENPGAGTDGQYYYYVMFSRALDATGTALVRATDAKGVVTERDWQNDLIDHLIKLQSEDGSFKSVDDRWMENNPILISAYSLLSLQHAARN
ncbi:MAG: hypothetical protein ACT4PL_14950 [Phycisphaerales bacterium]